MKGNWILLRTNDEPNVMTANGLISPLFFFPLWTCHFWETSLNIVVRWGWGVGCSKAFTRECQPTLQCNMYMLAEWVFMRCGHIPVISSKSLRYLVAFKEGDWRFSADVLTHSRPVAVLVPLRAVAYQSVLHVLLCCLLYTSYWAGPYKPALLYGDRQTDTATHQARAICPRIFIFIEFLNFKRCSHCNTGKCEVGKEI